MLYLDREISEVIYFGSAGDHDHLIKEKGARLVPLFYMVLRSMTPYSIHRLEIRISGHWRF